MQHMTHPAVNQDVGARVGNQLFVYLFVNLFILLFAWQNLNKVKAVKQWEIFQKISNTHTKKVLIHAAVYLSRRHNTLSLKEVVTGRRTKERKSDRSRVFLECSRFSQLNECLWITHDPCIYLQDHITRSKSCAWQTHSCHRWSTNSCQ